MITMTKVIWTPNHILSHSRHSLSVFTSHCRPFAWFPVWNGLLCWILSPPAPPVPPGVEWHPCWRHVSLPAPAESTHCGCCQEGNTTVSPDTQMYSRHKGDFNPVSDCLRGRVSDYTSNLRVSHGLNVLGKSKKGLGLKKNVVGKICSQAPTIVQKPQAHVVLHVKQWEVFAQFICSNMWFKIKLLSFHFGFRVWFIVVWSTSTCASVYLCTVWNKEVMSHQCPKPLPIHSDIQTSVQTTVMAELLLHYCVDITGI